MHLFTYPVSNKLKACFNTLCATHCLAASKTINAKTICKISSTQKTIKLKTKKGKENIFTTYDKGRKTCVWADIAGWQFSTKWNISRRPRGNEWRLLGLTIKNSDEIKTLKLYLMAVLAIAGGMVSVSCTNDDFTEEITQHTEPLW